MLRYQEALPFDLTRPILPKDTASTTRIVGTARFASAACPPIASAPLHPSPPVVRRAPRRAATLAHAGVSRALPRPRRDRGNVLPGCSDRRPAAHQVYWPGEDAALAPVHRHRAQLPPRGGMARRAPPRADTRLRVRPARPGGVTSPTHPTLHPGFASSTLTVGDYTARPRHLPTEHALAEAGVASEHAPTPVHPCDEGQGHAMLVAAGGEGVAWVAVRPGSGAARAAPSRRSPRPAPHATAAPNALDRRSPQRAAKARCRVDWQGVRPPANTREARSGALCRAAHAALASGAC